YLLELANIYALRKGNNEEIKKYSYNSIALCCIQKNNVSDSNELRVAYHPRENFNLRDFHHAVNSLSTDHLLPRSKAFEFSQSHQQVSCLSTLLTSNGGLYSWGPESIGRKVIMISSFFMENAVSFQRTVMDAADHCVTIEFIQIECEVHTRVQWGSVTDSMLLEKIKTFTNSISEFENCTFRRVHRDHRSFCHLVKRWLQDMKDELEEPLQALFVFKDNVVESKNKVFCNLFPSIMHIEDKFRPCQTCRCHGATIETASLVKQKDQQSVCPITGQELDTYDLTENGLKIGLETILLLPSFKKIPKLEPVSTTVAFNIIQCVRLASLSEGLFFGSSFVVLASSNHEMDVTTEDGDQKEANHQIFSGLCQVLNSIDCGLICTSSCDVECKFEATLPCFYLLQPSDDRQALLRRIAASEEILPIPDAVEALNAVVSEELIESINSSLTRMGYQDYNPLNHERGCHTKLNWLVKESLHFRSGPLPTPKPQQNLPISSHRSVLMSTPTHHGEQNLSFNSHRSMPIEPTKPLGEQNLPIIGQGAEQRNLQPDNMRKKAREKMNMSPGLLAKKQIPSILERIEPLRTFNKLNISSTPSVFEAVNQSIPFTPHTQAHRATQTSKSVMGIKKPLLPFEPSQLPKPSLSQNPLPQLKPNFRRIKRTKNSL
ncbi:hypothetical protein KI387_032380, partial [Taxus chinensis]